MSKDTRRRPGGEVTKARVFASALALFRQDGFDATTMRDVARGAGLSLGAAYHYFPSKAAIVTELFRTHLDRHAEVARGAMARATGLRARLEAAYATGFEVRREDRAALSSLTRVVLDAGDPASLFAPDTADLRAKSIAIFREAVECDEVAADVRDLAAVALWALQLGLLLFFVRDDSPGQERTYRILARVLNVLPGVLAMAGSPLFAPVRAEIEGILAELGYRAGPATQG